MIWKLRKEAIIISLIQHFEADFLWKVSLKILNSGLILKTFTHGILNKNNQGGFWVLLDHSTKSTIILIKDTHTYS